jgi:two-component system chemotaxis response regulator CheB
MAGAVAIGASLGGVEALRTLIAGLPRGFHTPLLIVLHVGASRSLLPAILNDVDGDRAAHAVDGERINAGRIYVAPPDHHMLVADGHLRLSRAPRENWARPAIDPLFRTVAQAFGSDAIGIVLSGNLNDGTAGLYEIKQHGGLAIVQDPAEADGPSMPRSALENVAVDYCVPVADIPDLLARLTAQFDNRRKASAGVPMSTRDENFSTPVAQTCPECGGATREEQLGTLTQFRCHIGHVMTAEVLATASLQRLENDISVCVRASHERADLCREIARKHETQGAAAVAQNWLRAAQQAAERTRILAGIAEKEWIDPINGGLDQH